MRKATKKLTVEKLGEWGVIERLTSGLRKVRKVELDIGDDAAIFDLGGGKRIAATTDMLVEGVHFRRKLSMPYEIGWRAMASGLSDLAAMGATPTFALVSLGLPEGTLLQFAEEVYSGIGDIGQIFYAAVIGGDTVRSPRGAIISVSMIGEIRQRRYLTRSGAKQGDAIIVSGFPGASGAGLELLRDSRSPAAIRKKFPSLAGAHNRPYPRVDEGLFLAEHPAVHAAIDISDGIASEIHHICRASGMGGLLDSAAFPYSDEMKAVAGRSKGRLERWALEGGEDCELLFTVDEKRLSDFLDSWKKEFVTPCTPIGRIESAEKGVRIRTGRRMRELPPAGYDHFREAPTRSNRKKTTRK